MDQIIVGSDPVLIDSYVASLMGFTPEDIPYIKIAESIGVGSCKIADTQVCKLMAA